MGGCKVVILCVVFQLATSKLFHKDVNIEKKFEFSISPHPIKAHGFMSWQKKIGHIISHHTVGKRSPFDLAQKDAESAPLYKVELEKSITSGTLLPPPPPPPLEVTPVPPIFISNFVDVFPSSSLPPPLSSLPPLLDPLSRLPSDGPEKMVEITPPPPPPPMFIPPSSLPPMFMSSTALPPIIGPSSVLPPVPLPPAPVPPPPGLAADQLNLLTNIAKVDQINTYLKAVEGLPAPVAGPPDLPEVSNTIEVEPPKPEEKLSPLAKGSRLALYFGNILLQVMSEVISSARSAMSQYSLPALN